MNIGIVTSWYPCGAGFVSRSYETVLKLNNNVFIYARGGINTEKETKWNLENVTRAPFHPCSTGIYEKHFKNWISDKSIKVVIFNEQRYWNAIVNSREMNVLTGAYIDYYTADTVPLFDLYDFLICNTKRHFSVFKNHFQITYIPWGTDTNLYKPIKSKPKSEITFIISAGWDGLHSKNVDWLDRKGTGLSLNVFPKVRGNCKLIVYSQIPLDGCRSDWKTLINNDRRIEFRFGTFDPFPYNEGDIYLYPSRLDGIGLSVPEALSCGLPVITTNSAPMNEFVKDKVNGLIVDVKEYRGRPDGYYWAEAICDEDKLVKAIQYYIDNPNEIITHGSNARSIAEESLNWERNSMHLDNWIKNQKRLIRLEKNDLIELTNKAKFHDYLHSPTPLQRIKIGFKSLALELLRHFKKN